MFRKTSFLVVLCLCTQISAGPPKESTKEPPAETKEESSTKTDEERMQALIERAQKTSISHAWKTWTYEKLIAESDVVLIGMFKEKKEVEFSKADTETLQGDGDGYLGIESSFDILGALKADPKWKQTPKTCTVFHFAYDPEQSWIILTGPNFINFSIRTFSQPCNIAITKPEGIFEYVNVNEPHIMNPRRPRLMFLKARADGRYEPVTGQYFASLSFRTVGG